MFCTTSKLQGLLRTQTTPSPPIAGSKYAEDLSQLAQNAEDLSQLAQKVFSKYAKDLSELAQKLLC